MHGSKTAASCFTENALYQCAQEAYVTCVYVWYTNSAIKLDLPRGQMMVPVAHRLNEVREGLRKEGVFNRVSWD